MSARSKLLKAGLPLLIIISAIFLTKIMIDSRPSPAKKSQEDRGALVETTIATKTKRPIRINSTGTVQPHQEITIIPQVSGRVTSISDKLTAGGFFAKGETLFSLETIDYELAVQRANASMAKREFELSSMESKARIARQEWDRLKKDQHVPPNSLALYEPQLKDAKANLASAQASLRQAEIDLARTSLKAPFNCVVRSESLDLGQYVKSGSAVMILAGSDEAEIIVPVKLDDLHWLTIPGPTRAQAGSAADIVQQTGNRGFTWQGMIVRTLAEVDPQGRMARLVVAIKDPYLLQNRGEEGQPPLAIGSFVDVSFKGRTMDDIFALPRQALRDNSTVWIMAADNLLEIKTVKTLRLERDEVFIREGLEPGDRVILTNLTGAATGMKLRSASKGDQS